MLLPGNYGTTIYGLPHQRAARARPRLILALDLWGLLNLGRGSLGWATTSRHLLITKLGVPFGGAFAAGASRFAGVAGMTSQLFAVRLRGIISTLRPRLRGDRPSDLTQLDQPEQGPPRRYATRRRPRCNPVDCRDRLP